MSYATTYITLWILDTTELKSTWLIYLTNQSMLLLVIHLLLEMALAIKAFISQKNGRILRMEFWEKTSWFLANITNGICPVVSIFYWTFLFPSLEVPMSFEITFLHLFNTVCVLLDLCVTARPMRIGHIIYPVIVGLSYAAFSLIYWVLGGTDSVGNSWIYPQILSWEKPGLASLTTSVCVTGVVLSHVFFWCCTKMREHIYKSLNSENHRKRSVIKEFVNEKGQPIYALPSHFIR